MENIDWNLIVNITQLILIIFVIFYIRDWRINWWNEEVSWRRLEIERYENLLYQQEILEKITQKLEIKQ
jgi:hypothetical protein|tara:strand:- start:245 stop:451 length:207 start_codon:yes stop_codon:yes gene_type:complete